MIGIILAFLLGYYFKQSEKKEQKQLDQQYTGSAEYDGKNYGYVKEGESVEDLR